MSVETTAAIGWCKEDSEFFVSRRRVEINKNSIFVATLGAPCQSCSIGMIMGRVRLGLY